MSEHFQNFGKKSVEFPRCIQKFNPEIQYFNLLLDRCGWAAEVLTPGGLRTLAEVCAGDRVLSIAGAGLRFEPVLCWLHRDVAAETESRAEIAARFATQHLAS